MLQDGLEVCLRQHIEVRLVDAEPIGPHLDLVCALLAADVEDLAQTVSHVGGKLREQGAFTHARIATDEHH